MVTSVSIQGEERAMGANSRSSKFQRYIKSELLGEEKIITAPTKAELRIKVERQLRLWEEQEVLRGTKPGWKGRGNTPLIYPPFLFKEPPTYEASACLFVPTPTNPFFEIFSPGLRKERERAEALAREHYQQALTQ